ncbi:MAG TPA: winged helix-turn-helix domain-containing protein [Candidatus Saccharimonadales bacterium]|nr:winged helix-turn-helix domain-containing protein [Candidatus Saccharimonadales bacterium]
MIEAYNSPNLDAAFTALGYGKRRGMIHALAFRPATVSQLAKEFKLSLPAIHKHIRLLEKAKLIQRKKVGRVNFLALNRRSLKETQDWIMQFNTDWGSDKETLENYIAGLSE